MRKAATISIGAALDLMFFLNQHPTPLVVGQDYPADRLLEVVERWATDRGIDINLGNRDMWLSACRAGYFNDDDIKDAGDTGDTGDTDEGESA